ncbi:MAG: divalent-cation tolerance protein CutA [Holosporaceae bacterium]|jgi:periplasmic divalent cation tolerance protein|nr:divalent-cation tolerance protein CutA [Holosporaceae bacterium]
MNRSNFVIVLTTIETKQQAEVLTKKILEKKLAACIQIQKIQSRYWWNGKIERSDEYLLAIKAPANLFAEISNFIKKNHSYETPEIVQIPVTDGSKEYLDWIRETTE